jgi:hypothetical protein
MHATHHALAFALRACKCGSKSSAAALCEAARSPAYASLLTGATVCHPRTARLRIPIKLQPAQATGAHSHTAELLRSILAEARSPACYRRRCTSLGAQHPFCRCTGTTSGPPVPPHIVQRRPRGCRAMDRAKPRAAALCLATAGLRGSGRSVRPQSRDVLFLRDARCNPIDLSNVRHGAAARGSNAMLSAARSALHVAQPHVVLWRC